MLFFFFLDYNAIEAALQESFYSMCQEAHKMQRSFFMLQAKTDKFQNLFHLSQILV